MFDTLNHITLSGEEYPIKCDLIVLEKIQDEFGTVGNFENKILNWEYEESSESEEKKKKRVAKFPDAHAVNFVLPLMINEGIEIENETAEKKRDKVDSEKIIRKVDQTLSEIADIVHTEFIKCFKTKNA